MQVQITYKVINPTLKPIIKIEIGQWWLYRVSNNYDWPDIPDDIDDLASGLNHVGKKICVIAISDIIPGLYGGDDIKIEFMIVDQHYCPYKQTDTEWFADQYFSVEEDCFVPFWDLGNGLTYKNTTKPIVQQYGVDCVKCKKHYDYAVRVSDFECWSCKNGF